MAGRKQAGQAQGSKTENPRSPIGDAVCIGAAVGSLAAIEAVATMVDARAAELGMSPVGTDVENQVADMSAGLREDGVADEIAEARPWGRSRCHQHLVTSLQQTIPVVSIRDVAQKTSCRQRRRIQ